MGSLIKGEVTGFNIPTHWSGEDFSKAAISFGNAQTRIITARSEARRDSFDSIIDLIRLITVIGLIVFFITSIEKHKTRIDDNIDNLHAEKDTLYERLIEEKERGTVKDEPPSAIATTEAKIIFPQDEEPFNDDEWTEDPTWEDTGE